MTEISKTVRLRIAKWYVKNILQIEQGFNAHFEWPPKYPPNECLMTITCFDDYPYPLYRKNKDDLESYLIRKFGSMIIEDKRKPKNLEVSAASKGIPLTHPVLKQDKKDYPSYANNFESEYYLPLTKAQLLEANSTLSKRLTSDRIKPDHIKKTSGYESDVYNLRIGKWQ